MAVFTIHQSHTSDAACDHLNSVGWDGDFAEFQNELEVRRDVKFFGSEKFRSEMFEVYNPVARCEADDLDEVFHIGNTGPQDALRRYMPMHSVSVGDIIETHTGEHAFFMVDGEGFTQVEVA